MKEYFKWIGVLLGLYFLTFFTIIIVLTSSAKNVDQNRVIIASVSVACIISSVPAIVITRAFQRKTRRISALVGSGLYLGSCIFCTLPLNHFFQISPLISFLFGLAILICASLLLGMSISKSAGTPP